MLAVRHVVTADYESPEGFPPARRYADELSVPPRWINEKTLRKGKLPTPRSKEEANMGFHLPIHLPDARSVERVRQGRRQNEVLYRPPLAAPSVPLNEPGLGYIGGGAEGGPDF